MSEGGVQKLSDRANALAAQGAEPLRVEAIHRARRFKRSWLEMAELLTDIKLRRKYEAWGYGDLYAYAADELQLKRGTVEKLTGSYRTIERYAPELLEAGGDDARLPSFDAVDYFARAIGEREGKRADAVAPEVLDQLKDAVFEDARPIAAIRREFHATLYPKSEDERAAEHAERTRAQVKRLLDALPALDGIPPTTRAEVQRVLERLEAELARLATPAADAASAGPATQASA
ncbi:MAG: hypothetical protein FJ096_06395 [Deltaproteobacteria bacterium]|nr:hypothetical protein [Deltaproteobacteria bacterium]